MPDSIEEIQLAGSTYKIHTQFPAIRMMEFRSAYRNAAKKIIYKSMLEIGELSSPIGYQMVNSGMADSWINQSGFDELDFLRVLCAWIGEPVEETDDAGNKKPVKPLLDAVIETGEDGIELLKLFFIGLTLPTKLPKPKKPLPTPSSKKAGRGKKIASPKA